jgi:hypothetical protein
MSRLRPKQNAQPRTGYATCADICEHLARDMKSLYLLAFLLTRSHTEAERCFLATVEDCVRPNCVFKGWERSWSKRCLISNAIRLVFSGAAESDGKADSWCGFEIESQSRSALNALTRLAPRLPRFVFVMSVLERYLDRDCALLLACPLGDVVEARIHALRQLSSFNSTFTKTA